MSRPNGLVSGMTFVILVWTFQAFPQVFGYPGGAPVMACLDMFPSGHGSLPQSGPPPYKLLVPKKKYDPNTTIKISLIATQGYFRGVFIQARRVGCLVNATEIVGAFTINDNELEATHCLGQIHSAVTHKTNSRKTRKDIYWTPPVNPAGHVVIRATFVKEKAIFWVDVESEVLVDLQEMDTPECIATTVRPIPAFTTTPTPSQHDNIGDNNIPGKYSSGSLSQRPGVFYTAMYILTFVILCLISRS